MIKEIYYTDDVSDYLTLSVIIRKGIKLLSTKFRLVSGSPMN